jgi:hypothetical protein
MGGVGANKVFSYDTAFQHEVIVVDCAALNGHE